MARLAWFSPLPPVRSGVAVYSAELLPRLSRFAEIDVFVDLGGRVDGAVDVTDGGRGTPGTPPGLRGAVRSAHEFLRLHDQRPYDLVVYQMGNAACHDYMWPYLVRFPGLVVLHDAQLHHARARALLTSGRADDYRAEFAFNHPEAPAAAAEYAVSGLRGTYYHLYPMLRAIMTAARGVAVHNARLARELAARYPDTRVWTLRMGVSGGPAAGARGAVDAEPWAPGEAPARPLVAAFGLVTRDKRIPQLLRAFVAVASRSNATLALVGGTTPFYDVSADICHLGLERRVIVGGYVSEAEHDRWLAAADLCVSLRWPTSRETSASWLRALAFGKATVVTDLADRAVVPTLDPRTWLLQSAAVLAPDEPPPHWEDAVAVAIDILDEQHSLELALARLLDDEALRRMLAANARRYWRDHHTLDHMTGDYARVLYEARHLTAPAPHGRDPLPSHLTSDGTGKVRAIAGTLGVEIDFLARRQAPPGNLDSPRGRQYARRR